ncbi:putative holin [Pseudomonas citronellolis]|uniref:putative holin n=1 Tax=Pseudomonas citronellolis TaxID=53408 RepID=UPI0009F67D76|nr:putative holin [Pseudomonas humi]
MSLFPGRRRQCRHGAFAGSLLFVMTAADRRSRTRRVLRDLVRRGVPDRRPVRSGLHAVLPARIDVHAGIGALISSALVVKLLLWLIAQADAPDRLLNVFKGREK